VGGIAWSGHPALQLTGPSRGTVSLCLRARRGDAGRRERLERDTLRRDSKLWTYRRATAALCEFAIAVGTGFPKKI